LKGHNGCVNCLEWNRAGSLLISGSDDLTVNIWKPFSSGSHAEPVDGHKKSAVIKPVASHLTQHVANIFGVKFLQDERVMATCAADGMAFIIDIETNAVNNKYNHEARVKRLAVSCPNTFYSACEDGNVSVKIFNINSTKFFRRN